MLVWLTEGTKNLMVEKPSIKEVEIQSPTFNVGILVKQTSRAVKVKVPVTLSLVKNLLESIPK